MTFAVDAECVMPAATQRRNYDLNRAAVECFELRNAEADPDRAQTFHEMGDRFLSRAIAITKEWEG